MDSTLLEFRNADHSEADKLALVLERANAERDGISLPTVLENDQTIGYIQERMSRIDARTQVAIYGRKIIGFAISHPLIDPENYSEDTDTEHLSLLMIDPDYWGRRIASRLLDITVKHALDTGRSHLTLWTRERDNRRAQAVYEHKGFSLTGIPKTTKDGRQVHYQLDL